MQPCFFNSNAMKKKTLILLFFLQNLLTYSQVQTITPVVSPNPFERNQSITITVQGSQINEATWGVTNNALYYWGWMLDANNNPIGDCPSNGVWTSSSETNRFVYNAGNDTYTLTFVPETFYSNTIFGKLGFLVKAKDGTGDKKTNDNVFGIGAFQYTLNTPLPNSTTLLNSGSNFTISAVSTNGNAAYNLFVNGSSTPLNTQNTASYSFTDTAISTNRNYELRITQGSTTYISKFSVVIAATPVSQAIPAGMVDGINYNPNDATKAILVLNAPWKSFVYVAGNFNNWNPNSTYLMKRDATSGSTKFWLELTGLTPGQPYAYQYWVCDNVNLPANSPNVVKTADPFSTLVLSPFDDPEIITLGVFPNLPVYATIAPGQEREVSLFQTGSNNYFSYNWSSATTNFVKPKKKDLVFYEVLIRDFDANRTYQDLINKIDYFRNLKINAIKIMPVMEFEGNMSWGYNTVFHMALDKRYGPPTKLKEFIDLCHQNGIAVILDLALNHVFGRSPLERMWMLDSDNDGWPNSTGPRTTTENPYINQVALHTYSVGSDLNHFRETGPGGNLTNTYAIRTIQYWINEFKIDGYRWDLTKGFTNQCSSSDETCTNGYRSDRVAKLKWYADKQWEVDPNFLVIFEHLGSGGSYTEEVEWANYLRSGDTKGIMQWRKMTDPYANLLKGNFADISGIADATDRFIGYAESHDEERVAYKALNEAGQTFGNLNKVHQRLQAMGSVLFLVPGPKMIWHFGDLGWEYSLFTCSNGSVQFNDGCKLDTKPQPQWTGNWLTDTNRSAIYNSWAKMIDMKKTENVFENGTYAWNIGNTGRPRLDVWTSQTQTSALSYVFVLTNFSDNTYNVVGGFPFTGTWANLMDNTTFNVTDVNMNISIEPGGYRVFGNRALLNNDTFDALDFVALSPNPASTYFTINTLVEKVQIYSITGQLVKSFSNASINDSFSIEDLTKGVYIVKISDANNREKTLRLIKE
jgi:1,4-alpha-glucan branching enzyme